MNSDDRKAWLQEHGLIRGFEKHAVDHDYCAIWASRGGMQFRMRGKTRKALYYNLHKHIKTTLFNMCNGK